MNKESMNFPKIKFLKGKWLMICVIIGALSTGILGLLSVTQFSNLTISETKTESSEPESPVISITALGRIEPQSKVIQVSATIPLEGARLGKLLVNEGDTVKTGQIIAILDSYEREQSALKLAQKRVQVAQARLNQVQAGAKIGAVQSQSETVELFKAELEGQIASQQANIASLKSRLTGEVQAQKATIERIKSEFKNAQTECHRAEMLYKEGAVSSSSRDNTCLQKDVFQEQLNEAGANLLTITTTLQQQIKEAKATLNRTILTTQKQIRSAQATLEEIKEVRPEDIALAMAELEEAKVAETQAKTNLALASVKAPVDGQILQIHTLPGETINSQGIVKMGQTQKMEVVAEVYQTDIQQIKLGKKVIISSDSFGEKLEGTVKQIGLLVQKQNIFSNDPGADVDRKVIEVKIALDPETSRKVQNFTYLQVQVAIQL
jgi:HlyD family secretion protein